MKRGYLLILACTAAAGQSPLTAPAWLSAYPNAEVETRTMPTMIESTYLAKAAPATVVAHYGKLFEAAGLPFAPSFDGMGTVIRASASECDLLIKVREQDGGAFVRVSCAVKTAAMVSAPTPAAASPKVVLPMSTPLRDRDEARRDHAAAEMAKYDEPVQTRPRTAPVWPNWLVDPAGKLPVFRRTAADSTFLSTSFAVAAEIAQVRDWYTGLLESHGCSVTGRGKAWFESSCRLNPKSVTELIVRAELSPVEGGTQVSMRVSSVP